MTFTEAEKIVRVFGRYLEYSSHILSIFIIIPESFLPFPREILAKALKIVTEYHHNAGDLHRVELTREIAANLSMYRDDEEALLLSAKCFNDSEWREKFLPLLKNSQEETGHMLINGLEN